MSRVVVKLGGRIAARSVAAALELHEGGHEVVVVHGAGPQISAELERRGLVSEFVDGRRVTSAAALVVVRESLLAVGAEVSAALGPPAIHLAGDEIGLRAVRCPELGYVGRPLAARPKEVLAALRAGAIPVVSPLAEGPLNVNADEAAAALAEGIGAQRIVFVSDVPGVLVGDDVVELLETDRAERLLETGSLEGGIVPKLLAAVQAARAGVHAEIGLTRVVA